MKNKTIWEIHQDILNKKISIQEITKEAIKKQEAIRSLNAVITEIDSQKLIDYAKQLDEEVEKNKDNLLYGIPYSLKDNISTKDIKTTGGSKFLENYVPVFDATVKKILDEHNAILLNKSNLDEFGLGGTGQYSAFGPVINPLDNSKVTGGSSSGSAVLVQQKVVNYAIATDTGDSIRRPASIMGIVGLKPSYGLISRFGVLPFSPSLDHVGIFSNNVFDSAIVLNALARYDENDLTSIKTENKNFYAKLLLKNLRKYKIAILKPAIEHSGELVKNNFLSFIDKIKEQHEVEIIDFDKTLLETIPIVYKIISSAEALSSYSNFTNITFANLDIDYTNYEDLIIKARTSYFGDQLKQRFYIGAFVTDENNFDDIYLKAKKARQLIVQKTKKILSKYDVILSPAVHDVVESVVDVKNKIATTNLVEDIMQIANFGGLPSITIPFFKNNNDNIGLNLIGNYLKDEILIDVAYLLESVLGDKNNE